MRCSAAHPTAHTVRERKAGKVVAHKCRSALAPGLLCVLSSQSRLPALFRTPDMLARLLSCKLAVSCTAGAASSRVQHTLGTACTAAPAQPSAAGALGWWPTHGDSWLVRSSLHWARR